MRAGNYISQPSGYKAFIPNPLPPQPPVNIDDEMWQLLSIADRCLGRLDGATEILPDPDLFVFMYVRKEAVLSSQIEGTQATLMDLLEFEASQRVSGKQLDVKEVVNYIAAMNYGLERLKEFPLSLRLIREIHAKLLKDVRGSQRNPGEFRNSQNWIGGPSPDKAIFVPPSVNEMQEAIGQFEKFLYDEHPMPILIKVGLLHYQFETIHPFLDGNGRMGRLLITFYLCQQNILKRPLLYLSYYFKKYRADYYDLLQRVRDDGDFESWLKYFLKGVSEVALEATDTARKIINLRENDRHRVADKLGRAAKTGSRLLNALYPNPIINIKKVEELAGLSSPNAGKIVDSFQKIGILQEITGQKRNRRFLYKDYLELLSK